MLHNLVKIHNFKKDLDLFFSEKSPVIYIKGFSGILKLYMPSTFFFKLKKNSLNFIFSNNFFFKSFVRHFLVFTII